MIVKRFFEPLLAQASYLIGCAASHEALVIDPNRDVEPYVAAAAADNLRITHVTETHIHADFLSGSRELARRTGAMLLLSDEGDHAWKYGYASEGRLIRGGDGFAIGRVQIDVEHTPGHTPEHLTFLITDGAAADRPLAAATGDFIFVGDVGRPDLLERAVHVKGTMEAGAQTLYRSLQVFNRHEEWLQIWPGHGAGSACGKGISAVPYSTLGYERRFNWAFKAKNETDFVANVLAGQPDPPRYFATMKQWNKEGPRVLGGLPMPPRLADRDLGPLIDRGAFILDARAASEFADGFVPGTLNIPLNQAFVTWAGWLAPYDQDLYVILGEGAEGRLAEIARALALIGLDRVRGVFGPTVLRQSGRSRARIPQIQPTDLALMRGDRTPIVVDVRADHEWANGHLPAAIHIPLGHLEERLHELPQGQPLIAQCQGGRRSAIAASVLHRAGYRDVSNLVGGFDAWQAAALPTTTAG
jgi:hydroxyacylglutathione hydrolase